MEIQRRPIFLDWPGPWERWARSYCLKNLWRMHHSVGELDDALAECAVQYVECRKRYGAVCDNPAWFMRMFQLMVTSRFHDMAVKDGRLRVGDQEAGDRPTTCFNDELVVLLTHRASKASDELKEVINLMFNAPTEVLQTLTADSPSPKKFFHKLTATLGINKQKAVSLEMELQALLR